MARASSNVSPSVTKSETGKKEISREGPPGVYPDGPIEPEFLIGGHALNEKIKADLIKRGRLRG
jgi:hypothetical protein